MDIIEKLLYVAAVTDEQHRELIGSVLVEVEEVPFEELLRRQERVTSADNIFNVFRNLAGTGALWQRCYLEHLLPEWKEKRSIDVILRHPDGSVDEYHLSIPKKIDYPLIKNESVFKIPSNERSEFEYTFLDANKKTCLLVVESMTGYREMFEWAVNMGDTSFRKHAEKVYERYHESKAPKDLNALIEGIPSATEIFRSMVEEMKVYHTEKLIIDLRSNEGGASTMSDILLYFLYGKEKLLQLKAERSQINKLSEKFFESYKNDNIDSLNAHRDVPLQVDDYDFSEDYFSQLQKDPNVRERVKTNYEDEIRNNTTFYQEYMKGEHSNYYRPKKVLVLSSPFTFSSGFTMMQYLYRAGAQIVGTPSAQAANCFGNTRSFKLKNSGLSGTVSFSQYSYFFDDPEKGKVLMPDYPLSYQKLASYRFDKHAILLYALDLGS